MKRILAAVLFSILLAGACACAEAIPGKSMTMEEQHTAIRAFLTADPEVTPEQAQAALGFLSIVHSKLGEAFRTDGYEKTAAAAALLRYIEEKDPELFRHVIDAVPEGITDTKPAQYVLNIRSNRFHRPECTGLSDMSEKNRVNFFGSRDILLATGFKPCQICMP